MSLKAWIKKIIWKLTWRRKLCRNCGGCLAIGNHGPCYSCREGSEYQYYEEIPEPKLETGSDYHYVFTGWGENAFLNNPPRVKYHTGQDNPWFLPNMPKGKPIVIYDREYDEDGQLKRFKVKYADEEAPG